MMADTKRKVPNLRFKGFTNDWEQQKLYNIGKFGKGRGYSKKNIIKDGTPLFLYGKLYTAYTEKIDKVDTRAQLLPNSVLSTGKEVILPDSGETAMDIARASWISVPGIILGSGLLITSPTSDIVFPGFLAYILSYGKNHRLLASHAQGKSIVHIHLEDLKKLTLILPIDVREQERIFSLLNCLNKLISLQQRKLNLIKQLKKGFLQKMFADKDSKQPVLRFKEFRDDWESNQLGNVFSEGKDRSAKGQLLSVSISKGVYPFNENERKNNSSKDKSHYKSVNIGDIAYNSMRMLLDD